MSFVNTFGEAPSFLRRRYSNEWTSVDLAITEVPFDQAVTYRPGARFGPRALREASSLLTYDLPYGWGFDPLSDFTLVDYGDMTSDYTKIAKFPAALTAHIHTILSAGASSLVLCGDHSISLPVLRAHAAKYGPLSPL